VKCRKYVLKNQNKSINCDCKQNLSIILRRINQLIYTKIFRFITDLVLVILDLLFLLCQSITALSSYK